MDLAERLRQARSAAGLTQKQVSERCGIDDSTLSAFEKGEREPRLGHLDRLARVYQIPLSSLLGAPMPSTSAVMWRNKLEDHKDIGQRFLTLCRLYHQLEVWTSERPLRGLPQVDDHLGDQFGYSQAADMAGRVRNDMAIGERPGESLYRILEEVYGVKVFHFDLGNKGVAASANGSDFGPAILMNSRCSRWRRNHDLAHELFHLLTWDRFGHAGNTRSPSEAEEKLATCFAGHLLLPEEVVRRDLDRIKSKDGRFPFKDLDEIARRFDVSLESLIWRMHFLFSWQEQTTQENVERARKYVEWAPRDSSPQPPERPERFKVLAIQALQEGHLSLGRFAEFMGISRKEASRYVSGTEPDYAETAASAA